MTEQEKIKEAITLAEDEKARLLFDRTSQPWDREQTVFEDGKQAGIREVLEWLTGFNPAIRLLDLPKTNEWQAKLKSWNVSA